MFDDFCRTRKRYRTCQSVTAARWKGLSFQVLRHCHGVNRLANAALRGRVPEHLTPALLHRVETEEAPWDEGNRQVPQSRETRVT